MRLIKDYVERIEEEVEDAKYYAEKYVEAKVKGARARLTAIKRWRPMS